MFFYGWVTTAWKRDFGERIFSAVIWGGAIMFRNTLSCRLNFKAMEFTRGKRPWLKVASAQFCALSKLCNLARMRASPWFVPFFFLLQSLTFEGRALKSQWRLTGEIMKGPHSSVEGCIFCIQDSGSVPLISELKWNPGDPVLVSGDLILFLHHGGATWNFGLRPMEASFH